LDQEHQRTVQMLQLPFDMAQLVGKSLLLSLGLCG
jgi:hypothetical protein